MLTIPTSENTIHWVNEENIGKNLAYRHYQGLVRLYAGFKSKRLAMEYRKTLRDGMWEQIEISDCSCSKVVDGKWELTAKSYWGDFAVKDLMASFT